MEAEKAVQVDRRLLPGGGSWDGNGGTTGVVGLLPKGHNGIEAVSSASLKDGDENLFSPSVRGDRLDGAKHKTGHCSHSHKGNSAVL